MKKLVIAGIAFGLGVSSVVAAPSCEQMHELCQQGQTEWCGMYFNSPHCRC